jgi:hypothetical protein
MPTNRSSSPVHVSTQLVTPEIAKRLLARMANDRPLSKNTLLNYTEVMRRGEWRFNGDPIRLNSEDRLIDGQHRLHAIIDSGKPQKMLVISGLDNEVFDTIDVGKKRSSADLLGIAGYQNVFALAATARALIIYESGVYWASEAAKNLDYNPTGKQIVSYVDRNPDVAQCVRQMQAQYGSAMRVVAPSAAGLAYTLAWRQHHGKADEFMSGVGGMVPTERNDPRWVVREYLSRQKHESMTKRLTSLQAQAVMVKAANLFFAGLPATTSTLRFQPETHWFPRFDGGRRDATKAKKGDVVAQVKKD